MVFMEFTQIRDWRDGAEAEIRQGINLIEAANREVVSHFMYSSVGSAGHAHSALARMKSCFGIFPCRPSSEKRLAYSRIRHGRSLFFISAETGSHPSTRERGEQHDSGDGDFYGGREVIGCNFFVGSSGNYLPAAED